MQHTTNYDLNQWDADDRVTREDFNADNAKIDSAIAAGASRLVKLYDQTLSADATRYDLDVAALGLSSYIASFVLIESATTYETSQTIRFHFDNDTGDNYTRYSSSSTTTFSQLTSGSAPLLLLLRSAPGSTRTSCLNIHFRSYNSIPNENSYYNKNLRDISTLNITARYDNYVIPAGTRFLVYGLKY